MLRFISKVFLQMNALGYNRHQPTEQQVNHGKFQNVFLLASFTLPFVWWQKSINFSSFSFHSVRQFSWAKLFHGRLLWSNCNKITQCVSEIASFERESEFSFITSTLHTPKLSTQGRIFIFLSLHFAFFAFKIHLLHHKNFFFSLAPINQMKWGKNALIKKLN